MTTLLTGADDFERVKGLLVPRCFPRSFVYPGSASENRDVRPRFGGPKGVGKAEL